MCKEEENALGLPFAVVLQKFEGKDGGTLIGSWDRVEGGSGMGKERERRKSERVRERERRRKERKEKREKKKLQKELDKMTEKKRNKKIKEMEEEKQKKEKEDEEKREKEKEEKIEEETDKDGDCIESDNLYASLPSLISFPSLVFPPKKSEKGRKEGKFLHLRIPLSSLFQKMLTYSKTLLFDGTPAKQRAIATSSLERLPDVLVARVTYISTKSDIPKSQKKLSLSLLFDLLKNMGVKYTLAHLPSGLTRSPWLLSQPLLFAPSSHTLAPSYFKGEEEDKEKSEEVEGNVKDQSGTVCHVNLSLSSVDWCLKFLRDVLSTLASSFPSSSSPSLPKPHSILSTFQDAITLLKKADSQHFNLLLCMQRMRQNLVSVSKDLNGKEVRFCRGFAENLFSGVVRQRERIVGWVGGQADLFVVVHSYLRVYESGGIVVERKEVSFFFFFFFRFFSFFVQMITSLAKTRACITRTQEMLVETQILLRSLINNSSSSTQTLWKVAVESLSEIQKMMGECQEESTQLYILWTSFGSSVDVLFTCQDRNRLVDLMQKVLECGERVKRFVLIFFFFFFFLFMINFTAKSFPLSLPQ